MNEDKAKKLVIFSAILVVILGWTHSLVPSKTNKNPGPPPINFFIRVAILFFILSALADFKPKLAGWFAVLISTTSVFQNAPDFLNFVQGLGQPAGAKQYVPPVVNTAPPLVPLPTLAPHAATPQHPAWPPPKNLGQVPKLRPLYKLSTKK